MENYADGPDDLRQRGRPVKQRRPPKVIPRAPTFLTAPPPVPMDLSIANAPCPTAVRAQRIAVHPKTPSGGLRVSRQYPYRSPLETVVTGKDIARMAAAWLISQPKRRMPNK
jgi:hypothetical protein